MGKPITECCQTNCSEPSTHKFVWPGKPIAGTCEKHLGALRGLAGIMSFHMHVEPMTPQDFVLAARPQEKP